MKINVDHPTHDFGGGRTVMAAHEIEDDERFAGKVIDSAMSLEQPFADSPFTG